MIQKFRLLFFISFVVFVFLMFAQQAHAVQRIIIVNEIPEAIIPKNSIEEHFRLRFQDKNIQFGFYHSALVQTSTTNLNIYFLNLYQPDASHIAMTIKNKNLDHLLTKNIVYQQNDSIAFLSRTLANISLQAFESVYSPPSKKILDTNKNIKIQIPPVTNLKVSDISKTKFGIQSGIDFEDAQGFFTLAVLKLSLTFEKNWNIGVGYSHTLLSSVFLSENDINITRSGLHFSLGYEYFWFKNFSIIPQINIGGTRLSIHSSKFDSVNHSNLTQSSVSFIFPVVFHLPSFSSISLYLQPGISLYPQSHRFYVDSQEIYYYGYTHFSLGFGFIISK